MPRTKKTKEKKDKSKEEIVEYFDVEKNGKEEVVKTTGTEALDEKPQKEQVKEESKMIRNVLVILGAIIIFIVAYYSISTNSSHFDYKGVKFDVVNEIAPYKTGFPVIYQNQEAIYNFYLRNDPRKNNVSFNGEIIPKELTVVNATNSLNCNGDGIIAVANMAKKALLHQR